MTELTAIPRIYMALAQWMSSLLYVALTPKRWKKVPRCLLCALFLGLQSAFLDVTERFPPRAQAPCMITAIGLMFAMIYLCSDMSARRAGFCCARAFLLSEMSASFEWMLNCYILADKDFTPAEGKAFEIMLLVLVYTGIFALMWVVDRCCVRGTDMKITWTDLAISAMVGVGAFVLGDMSDYYAGVSSGAELLYIRMLVDLCGLIALYAYHFQRLEISARYELSAANAVLKNQYEQYCASRETLDLINRKYHDLKHQIAALRIESDPKRRMEWLDEMEGDIRRYETENKTGNSVLDTILTGKSLYCQRNDIILTCVADGARLDFMKVMDICAIFGNALDNAIEGVMKLDDPEKRMIHLSVSARKGFLSIQAENYFGGELTLEDGLPVTTKQDKDGHGYGLKSIKSAVESYDGSMKITTDDGWFELDILIPLPEPDAS